MNFSEQEWKAAQSQMADADPEQLKAQARMMKNMDKNTVRRMNPQFANMSDQELDMMATQMEMMVELCGNQPVCRVRRRAGVASMAWRTTRRFRTNAP